MKRIVLACCFVIGVILLLLQGVALGQLALFFQDQNEIAISFWCHAGSWGSFVMAVFLALLGSPFVLWDWE